MIPKIIHYCWLSGDEIPENLKQYMKTWEEKLNGYEFILWDLNRFNLNKSQWVEEAFNNKKYAFAADYIRLYAVYTMGGIYMDMDIEVLKDFEPLLDKPYMLAYERDNKVGIEAGCFGAEKGNLFIKACLDRYEGMHFVKEDGSFDMRPLPQIMQGVMQEKGFDLSLYGCDYFTAKSFETGVEFPNENTFTIHHFAGSWKTDDEKEMIARTQRYSKFLGYKIARNVVDLQFAFKKGGVKDVFSLLRKKLSKKR